VSNGTARCVCLAGVDGTGKSTQARSLAAHLAENGARVSMVWLRFPHLSCAPLLAYARWRGYSREETVDGARHGYWEFDRSWLMSRVFPWFLLFDAWLLALLKVYLPLARGRTVLCDRCVLDTLVDLMAGLADSHFDERLPGRCILTPLPAVGGARSWLATGPMLSAAPCTSTWPGGTACRSFPASRRPRS
jgi:hypothetical protein